jgi:aminoglycoside/choline kinase family phosphotransferase
MIEFDEQQAKKFLAENNIKNCEIKKVAGDASFRSYYRVFADNKTFILMFAPPGYEDVAPFIKIAEFLVRNKFSAPKIFARQEEKGFLLLEDFGDETYGRVLAKISDEQLKNLELDLYKRASDCLINLHKMSIPDDLPSYNSALFFREVMLFVDWYLPSQNKKMSLQEKARFKFLWFQLFDLLSKENQVLVLRDYHADNLMTLQDRKNYQQVGLLDFQDAVIGPKAYDLVSLLEDARRDLDEENRRKIFDYYLQNSGVDKEIFVRDYEILSLQRNIKIVGIFSRLAKRDGKNQYLALLPRVLDFVRARLSSENKIFSEIDNLITKFI